MTQQQLDCIKLGKAFRWMRKGSAINRSEEDAIAYAVDGAPSNLQITLRTDAPRDPWHFEIKSDKLNLHSPEGFPSKNEALQGLKTWLMSNA